MEEKYVNVGIFWALPDEFGGWSFCEIKKPYPLSSANEFGFIDYPYSHYDKWDDEFSSSFWDPYYYPRGRVLYDTKSGKHRIFADECLDEYDLHEIVELFEIDDYEIWRDEHYVSPFGKKYMKAKCNNNVLTYNILRGKDKIGENLIEIVYGNTKLLVELGRALDGNNAVFSEDDIIKKHYSAVIVSHYHEDHAGLIKYKKDCPIFIGSGAYRILRAMSEFNGEEFGENIKTYKNGSSFEIGGIKITPFLCNHSAFDSYMLLFEAGGKSILYTGDFRFHGRKSKENLLSALPKNVDVLIHDGTNIGRSECTMTEAELEGKALEIMKNTDGPVFVLQSGSNIDRLVSIYRASKRSGRILYMDNYTSLLAQAAGGKVPRPDVFADVTAFVPNSIHGKRWDMFSKIKNKRGTEAISKASRYFTMLIRPNMINYIEKLFKTARIKNATLIYSIWSGYKNFEYMSDFLAKMQALGVNIVDLHTSGHASSKDIELLKETVNAEKTVCVHTQGRDIVIFDLETSGMNDEHDSIIEIGAIKLRNNKIISEFSSYVSCKKPLDKNIEALTGIKNEDLIGIPTLAEVMKKFYNFADGCVIMSYNLSFCRKFINKSANLCGLDFKNDTIDILPIVKERLYGKVNKFKLSNIAEYFGIPPAQRGALNCAKTTYKVFLNLQI